ncbi:MULTISPECIES: class I SAM-dependent methyltransferase [unclassified Moorena]|uniref:SAM-dependent methyltransferase n=1 Tax=unclassified Moorena TaxID=2683338 RepID=UPI0014016677|nr:MULTISPECIES: class I SAM-dependent methyltransferase [unclassified Moorena]NEO12116.1 methyltransferase domain-containing protein [Moorena sp. SIO3E8]NEP99383.1 methyltransferase domain-containing protein [Moorena sp. SIO3F7]
MIGNQFVSNFVSSLSKRGKLPISFVIHLEDGSLTTIGEEKPILDIYIKNPAGRKAFMSLDQLLIVEAYIKGDIDFEGNLIKAMSFQKLLSDQHILLKIGRRLKPILLGREKCNPDWISKHYDSNNIQLFAMDSDYNTYTPGIYEKDEDSLEVGAERKLDFAFQSLNLKPNDSVLDIGSGWGGFLRFAARRNIRVTGITLSNHQKQYVEDLIEKNNFEAEVKYQDFFSFQPSHKYDGIVMMGVMEDLSDYPRVMERLLNYLKPGGRVYLDFASHKESFGTHSFITKYIWPGTFRMVYMPEFIDAVKESPFEIQAIYNDRRNYYLWAKGMYERWMEKKADIIDKSNEQIWRTFRILFAATAGTMNKSSYDSTAYRVVLELPEDHQSIQ